MNEHLPHRAFVSASVLCCLFLISISITLFGSLLPFPSGGYSAQRFTLCFVLALLLPAGVIAAVLMPGLGVQNRRPFVLLAGIGLMFLGHGLVAESPFRWVEPGLFIAFLFSIVLVGSALGLLAPPRSYVKPFIVIIGAAVVLYAAMALNYVWFSLTGSGANISDYLPWGFVNIRYWSQLATWLLPLLPLALLNARARHLRLWRWAIIFGGAVWVWIALLSSARGTLLSLAVGALIAFAIFRGSSVSWLKQYGVLVLFGCVLWLCLSLALPILMGMEVGGRELGSGSSGRLVLWQEALAMSAENIPFGMGPQSWLMHSPLTSGYVESKPFGHPHNMYLMWAAEYGWLTVFLILVLLLGMARRIIGFQKRNVENGPSGDSFILCGFVASAAGALSHAAFSSVFLVPSSMLVGLFVLIALWAMLQEPVSDVCGPLIRVSSKRILLAVSSGLLVSIVAVVWVSVVFSYHQAMQADIQTYLDQSSDAFFPRFWYHGYFPR